MTRWLSVVCLLTLLTSAQVPLPALAQEDKPFSQLLEEAEAGDADSQSEVGVRYAEGIGVRRDNRGAVAWFRKSAEQANVYGACNLGLHYGRGHGVRKDVVLAMK